MPMTAQNQLLAPQLAPPSVPSLLHPPLVGVEAVVLGEAAVEAGLGVVEEDAVGIILTTTSGWGSCLTHTMRPR